MIKIIDNKIAAALFPLLPIVLGALFKFAVIDPKPEDPYGHLFNNYVVGAWIEIISVSLVVVITWAYASAAHESRIGKELAIVVAAPVLALICCIIVIGIAPKMGWDNSWTMVYLPLALSFLALAFNSVLIRELSK